jgi:nitroimidazol reductase NimA-like FMN-containing flavoprotein (pyridoxamine 5'-phosphate oxidase superfamily)
MIHAERSLTSMSRRECLTLLAESAVGRAVFTERAMPAVVPVNFVVQDDAIVMCTSPGSRLAAAATGGVLAFQVDDIDPSSRTGWSVVVVGVAELVDNPVEQARARTLLHPWAPGRYEVFLRLPVKVVTGRRILANDESEHADL